MFVIGFTISEVGRVDHNRMNWVGGNEIRDEVRAALAEMRATQSEIAIPLPEQKGEKDNSSNRVQSAGVDRVGPELVLKGQELLGRAAKGSPWTDEDALSLRQVLSQVDDEQHEIFMRQLVLGINSRRIKPAQGVMPF